STIVEWDVGFCLAKAWFGGEFDDGAAALGDFLEGFKHRPPIECVSDTANVEAADLMLLGDLLFVLGGETCCQEAGAQPTKAKSRVGWGFHETIMVPPFHAILPAVTMSFLGEPLWSAVAERVSERRRRFWGAA